MPPALRPLQVVASSWLFCALASPASCSPVCDSPPYPPYSPTLDSYVSTPLLSDCNPSGHSVQPWLKRHLLWIVVLGTRAQGNRTAEDSAAGSKPLRGLLLQFWKRDQASIGAGLTTVATTTLRRINRRKAASGALAVNLCEGHVVT